MKPAAFNGNFAVIACQIENKKCKVIIVENVEILEVAKKIGEVLFTVHRLRIINLQNY